ncbi:YqaJ-like viral recombinase domain protein [Roseovarius sp. A-2]|uniref:YqaJ viral recombinase family protein n=1 Tax=Roseovarius sp. A-2 TaxID=1570360 RepID=UPI0009B53CC6|nr:YqaJ viral recombinase family protein [Roseovarius sp. A-2]GAW33543.1 YqaJ-like viral recombinase domain protein [Roseovarius sp. A-2]
MSDREIFSELEQGSAEWLAARAGLITASNAGLLLVNGKRPDGLGAGALTYGYEIAGEILTGRPAPSFSNEHTERGYAREVDLRNEYELLTGNEVEQVGFVRRGRAGYSPDGLVDGGRRVIEIKDRLPKIALQVMTGGDLSKDEVAQAQFGMWMMGAESCDFIVGSQGLPTMIRTLEPDTEMHALFEKRVAALVEFIDGIVSKVKEAA